MYINENVITEIEERTNDQKRKVCKTVNADGLLFRDSDTNEEEIKCYSDTNEDSPPFPTKIISICSKLKSISFLMLCFELEICRFLLFIIFT